MSFQGFPISTLDSPRSLSSIKGNHGTKALTPAGKQSFMYK